MDCYRGPRIRPGVLCYPILLHGTPPHSHSIIRIVPNELNCLCKIFSALETPVAGTVRCAWLLKSKRNFGDSKSSRFQGPSTPIGRFFSKYIEHAVGARHPKKTVSPHAHMATRQPGACPPDQIAEVESQNLERDNRGYPRLTSKSVLIFDQYVTPLSPDASGDALVCVLFCIVASP